MQFVSTPNPHYIPGYTGFCPQYRYRIGDTYGTTTHKLLLDPDVYHAEQLVLSDRTANNYQASRPTKGDIDVVNARGKMVDALFKHPLIPGYKGRVPRENQKFGQTYTAQATEALAEFEQIQHQYQQANEDVSKLIVHNDQPPVTLDEETLKKMAKSKFQLPLIEVRPEYGHLLRTLPAEDVKGKPPRSSQGPDFLYADRPEDDEDAGGGGGSGVGGGGAQGDLPFGCGYFGRVCDPLVKSSICDFLVAHKKYISRDWGPNKLADSEPPFLISPKKLYHKHIGQVPNYGGHIPGAMFRYGKTYGNDTRDAKRWFRGDFT